MTAEMTLTPPVTESADLIGSSPCFSELKMRLPFVARAQRTTLLAGPTGAGKDVVAQALHHLSPRADQPFIAVHCAALPETLVEAEMFGHSRGAFTGATQNRPGLIRSASGGTLFLDEIDSLPLSAQAKLLRFLETGEYRAVGSDQTGHSSAWVIAATNQDLEQRVAQGTFRADLMYRLAVVKLEMPALYERREDILPLAEHFLAGCASKKRFDESARRALLHYRWPGNVRELRHRVESAAIFAAGETLDCRALGLPDPRLLAEPEPSEELHPAEAIRVKAPPALAESTSLEQLLWSMIERDQMTLTEAVARCERMMIQAALRAESDNRTRAARRLGIHVRTIFKKLVF